MRLRTRLFALAAAAAVPVCTLAQSAAFDIVAGGHKIGRDTYKIVPDKNGFKLTSSFSYSNQGHEGQFAEELRLSPEYRYIDGYADSLASPAHYGYTPNKDFTQLTISAEQGGSASSTFLTIRPDLVLLPNYDPGAAQAVLLLATTHPTPNNHYSVYVPGATGGGARGGRGGGAPSDPAAAAAAANDTLPPTDSAYDAVWVKGSNVLHGTLDGQPVNVHLYALAFGTFRWIFMADDQNNLLQCNVSLLHASYIRSKFKLDPMLPGTATPAHPS